MTLAIGVLACLVLWWLSKLGRRGDGLVRRFARSLGRGVGAVTGPTSTQRIGGALALAAAGFLLLRGNLGLAIVLGLGGLWMLEGRAGIAARLGRLVPRPAPAAPGRRYRTALVEVLVRPDGTLGEGRVVAGPAAGARLDDMAVAAVMDLLRACAGRDPEGAAILEAYLDRRAPGWRVDGERDADPRAGRPAYPETMTQEEAHEVLGLQRGASTDEIRAAHRALMKRAHPDQGGSAERAARVNAARDRLLNRHR